MSNHLETHYIPDSKQRERPRKDLKVIGKSIRRVEDTRLLTGSGRYIDDIELPGMCHAAILRSPYAHARIVSIDTSKARELPGVVAIVTGSDAAKHTGPVVTFASPPVEQRCIALDKVRHAGEAVAAVVAESRYIAEDAIDLIEVEYEELPVVATIEDALTSKGQAVVHPERGDSNIAHEHLYSFGDVDSDFDQADHIIKRKLRWNRSGPYPLEYKGAVAEFDKGTGKFTCYANSSMYNYVGWLCAASLGVAPSQLNIKPVVAGGSFGSKLFNHKSIILTCTLARAAGRPVKYVEDAMDAVLNSDAHGSDRLYDAEIAVDSDGKIRSLRFDVFDDYGAFIQYGYGTHGNALSQIIGPYKIKSVAMKLTAVLTNKCQQGAYRGFGSEVMNFLLERMVDAAADELGIDKIEIRRRNLIQPDEFPYVLPSGNIYDSGNYPAVLEKALSLIDIDGWRKKQAEARKEGKHIGIGVVTCQERSVFSSTEFWSLNKLDTPGFALTSSPESIRVKIDPMGKIYAELHAPFWGNSPETMVTQVLAEQFTVDPSDIIVGYADTDGGLPGTGPGGSRFTVMITGAAVSAAREIKGKLTAIAAHMLQVAEDSLEFRDAGVGVTGDAEKHVKLSDLAMMSHYFRLNFPDDAEQSIDGRNRPPQDFSSGLQAAATYDHPMTTMPDPERKHLGIFYPIMGNMAHVAVIEVDQNTGRIQFLDYAAVHDAGVVVNPKTLAGHIRGGTAQGIGTALYEEFQYDAAGQLLNASLADYRIPGVFEVPSSFKIGHVETPSPYTEYGIKGGGEGGRMASPAVIAQAVEDALSPFNVLVNELPIPPGKLHGLINGGTS